MFQRLTLRLTGLSTLVIIAVINSVVSAFFYLRVLRAMYMQPQVPGAAFRRG